MTPTQIDNFHAQGYLVVENVFTDADLQPVVDEITDAVDTRARALVTEGKLSQTYQELPFETRLAAISRETDQVAREIWNGALAGPAFFHLISHPRLLDIAEALCGPELIASSVYRLRPKIPHYGYGVVPWHQDSGYFEPYCDKSLVLTVWLPLVDATEENGCLWAIPGAHRGDVVRHQWSQEHPYLEIPEDALPEGSAVCLPVSKGGIVLLTNRTPHVSFDNNTEIVRWSMDLRYQSASLPTNALMTRLPGESSALETENAPIACYPPEADFLVRSRLRPHEVLTNPAIFRRLRETHHGPGVTARWSKG